MAVKDIKSKLEELERKKHQIKPKIEEIEKERTDEINELNKKYDHIIDDIKQEVTQFEDKIMHDMIQIFERVILDEFDAKRSTSEYTLTNNFKEFREEVSEINIFPKELVDRLDKVINGDPIEKIAYDLEKIKDQFKMTK